MTLTAFAALAGTPATPTRPSGNRSNELRPDPSVLFDELPNGLRMAVMPNSEPLGRVSLRLLILAGSLQERDDQRGLAHYLEHMAFKGTANFAAGALVAYFQNLGMSFGPDANAYTGFDRTVYQIELPDNRTESVDDALLVLRDFAAGMLIAEDEVEAERGVILSEKRTRDSVRFRTALAEFAFLLPDAIVAERFPIGAEKVLRETGRDDLVGFYETWYRPERAAVIVVGDIDPAKVAPLIAGHFSDFEAKRPAVPPPDPGSVGATRIAARLHHEPEAPYVRVAIQSAAPYARKPDTARRRRTRMVRAAALQMLSRRLDRLAEEPGAPFSRGAASAYDLFDLFTNASVDLTTTRPDNWAEALAVAENELRRALRFGFLESEVREVRANLLNAFEENARRAPTRRSRDLAEALIAAIVENGIFTDPRDDLETMRPALEDMTAAECLEALRAAFPQGNRLIFVTGNIGMENTEKAILEVFRNAADAELEPPSPPAEIRFAYAAAGPPGEIAERRYVEDLDLYQARFANQVRLTFKTTGFASNQVMMAVRIGNGQLAEPPERPGLAWMASETFIRAGLGRHSHDDLRTLLAGRNVGWTFKVEPDAFVFRGATTPADLELQLRLLAAYLTDPGFRAEALRRARETHAEQSAAARHSAEGVLGDRVAAYLAGGDARFGLPPGDVLTAPDLEELRAWLTEPLLRDALEIGIVGDLPPPEDFLAAAAATVGALPERRADKPDLEERRILERPPPGAIRRFEFPSRLPGGYAAVYWPAPDIWDIGRTRRLGILARVFTDRMRLLIRDEMGEAYSAHAVNHASDVFRDYGWFYGIAAVSPDGAAAVAEVIGAIARDLHAGTIDADEHQRALRPVLASLRDARRDNAYWLNSVMISAWEHPQRLEWAREMTADFESIGVDDLNELARIHLNPEQARPVFVLPRADTGDGRDSDSK